MFGHAGLVTRLLGIGDTGRQSKKCKNGHSCDQAPEGAA